MPSLTSPSGNPERLAMAAYHSGPTRIGILADLNAPSLPIEEAILIGDIHLTPISGPALLSLCRATEHRA